MLKQKLSKLTENPLLTFISASVLWFAEVNLLLIFCDKVWVSIFSLMLCFGLIYPVISTVIFFKSAKKHGVVWYFPAAVIAACVTEYVLYDTFRAIIPNIIVLTLLCLLFGCGIGDTMSDKSAVQAAREQRRLKKLGEDKPYYGILNDNSIEKNKSKKR